MIIDFYKQNALQCHKFVSMHKGLKSSGKAALLDLGNKIYMKGIPYHTRPAC